MLIAYVITHGCIRTPVLHGGVRDRKHSKGIHLASACTADSVCARRLTRSDREYIWQWTPMKSHSFSLKLSLGGRPFRQPLRIVTLAQPLELSASTPGPYVGT